MPSDLQRAGRSQLPASPSPSTWPAVHLRVYPGVGVCEVLGMGVCVKYVKKKAS